MTSRLIQGRSYMLNGKPYRAGLVNHCRARLDPLFTVARTIRPLAGRAVTIQTHPDSLNVSPNTILEEVRP